MTMNHSQIQKKNNFQPDDQITTVYKNSSFQPEYYFSDRGFFIIIIISFSQFLKYRIFSMRRLSTTYCDQTNIRKGYPYKQFQPLISDTLYNLCSSQQHRRQPYELALIRCYSYTTNTQLNQSFNQILRILP